MSTTTDRAISRINDIIDMYNICCGEDDKVSVSVTIPIDFFDIESMKTAIKALESNTWIPVSERLPNNHEYIKNNGLFVVSDGNRSYSEWFDIYDTQRFGEPTIYGFRLDNCVTAWKPLPEPYKGVSE